MEQGNSTRTIAATNMNATSSRSHMIVTLVRRRFIGINRYVPDLLVGI